MFFSFTSSKFHVVSSLILRTGILHGSMCTLLLQAQAGQGKSEKKPANVLAFVLKLEAGGRGILGPADGGCNPILGLSESGGQDG